MGRGSRGSGVPVVICCAGADQAQIAPLVESLGDEAHTVELLAQVKEEPSALSTAVARHQGEGLYVLCRSKALGRDAVDALRDILLTHHVPFGRTLTVTSTRPRELQQRIADSLRRMVASGVRPRAAGEPGSRPEAASSPLEAEPPRPSGPEPGPETEPRSQPVANLEPNPPEAPASDPVSSGDRTRAPESTPEPSTNEHQTAEPQAAPPPQPVPATPELAPDEAASESKPAPAPEPQPQPAQPQPAQPQTAQPQSAQPQPAQPQTAQPPDDAQTRVAARPAASEPTPRAPKRASRPKPPQLDAKPPRTSTPSRSRTQRAADDKPKPAATIPPAQSKSAAKSPLSTVAGTPTTREGGSRRATSSGASEQTPPRAGGLEDSPPGDNDTTLVSKSSPPRQATKLGPVPPAANAPAASSGQQTPREAPPGAHQASEPSRPAAAAADEFRSGETKVSPAPSANDFSEIQAGLTAVIRVPSGRTEVFPAPPKQAFHAVPTGHTAVFPAPLPPARPGAASASTAASLSPTHLQPTASTRSSSWWFGIGVAALVVATLGFAAADAGSNGVHDASAGSSTAVISGEPTSPTSPTVAAQAPDSGTDDPDDAELIIINDSRTHIGHALRMREIQALDTLLVSKTAGPLDYAGARKHCTGLAAAGLNSWRLPEVGELITLTSARMTQSGHYWSATPADTFGDQPLVWWAQHERIVTRPADSYVVCVRGGTRAG